MMRSLLHCLAAVFILVCGTKSSAQSPATEAEARRLFNAYKPAIQATNKALVDEPRILTGDLNADGRTDAIAYFVMRPEGGGNVIIGRGAAVYLAGPKGLKVAGAFPEIEACWAPDEIRGGMVYATAYECAPPYMDVRGKLRFRWNGKKMVKM